MKTTVLFIDEDAIERRSCVDVLKEIFAGTPLELKAIQPLDTLAGYAVLVNQDTLAALILDQRLQTSGQVNYSGAELAAYLRGISCRIPIVILTNYHEDDFSHQGWAVEWIISKHLLRDPSGVPAQEFKKRLTRQIETCSNLLAARENRFHELIVKSSREQLTPDEENELRELNGERVAPVAAEEREKQAKLDTEIATLKKLLGRDSLL